MKTLKILIAGLSNAGKTSILRILDNDYESIPKLTPTLGVAYKNYKVMGLDFTTWDMGGQTRYREKYLLDFQKIFEETNTLFYVIDFQAEELFDEVVTYLKGIIGALKKLRLTDVFIPVLFHKVDPHIQSKRDELDLKLTAIRGRVEKVLAKIDHAFYETSMYEPFTIFKAFSEGILHKVSGAELIFEKIGAVGTEFGSHATVLLATGGYIYGNWHSKDVQLTDLVKFYRTIQDFSHVLSDKENPPFMAFPLTETHDIIVITFLFKNQYVAFCMMMARTNEYEKLKKELSGKSEEFKKVLQIIA